MKLWIVVLLALLALPATATSESEDKSVNCLLTNAYHEARGEGVTGILLVSKVVMNRSEKTGKTVCEVLKMRGQFSWKGTKQKVSEAFRKEHREIVKKLYIGDMIVPAQFTEAFYYHSVHVNPIWKKKVRLVGTYGNHRFYKGD